MDIKNLILIIIAVLNFFFGLVIVLKNYKNQINLIFGLLLFSVVGWSIGLAMSRELAGTLEAIRWGNSTYFFSACIALFFLCFSFIFPLKRKIYSISQKIMILLPFLFILLIVLKGDLIIKDMVIRSWGYDVIYGRLWYLSFSIYFISYMSWAYINIWKSYKQSVGYSKFQLKFILIGCFIAGVLGTIFDLILPYYNYWKLNWLGPYFTVVLLSIVSYLIFWPLKKM